ncbi:uncharacterized protein LOC130428218 [Triplophysa dalaica]|uniref:uncharacterized protein LOC130428218 n=1 Tax=Triplophysa dalaica TaxID=1582913 RepID=UPI0024DFD904|nr:uncharacterized protein LOC130428218 [Triplophysa dalaica]
MKLKTLAKIINLFELNYKRVNDGHPRQYTTDINVPKWQYNHLSGPEVDSIVKKAQQRLYFLRQLRTFILIQELLTQFYSAVIESVLCTSITVWINNPVSHHLRENSSSNIFKELSYTIMILTVAQRSLILIVLLHPCILIEQHVNTKTLANIVKAIQAKLGKSDQYTVALRVEKEKCLDDNYSGQDLITEDVKTTIVKKLVYNSNNLIAAKPLTGVNTTEHSEYRLINYLKEIMNVKDGCVIYFTLNSPCLKTCLAENGKYTINGSLTKLQNYKGVKALAFKKVWEHDDATSVRKRLRTIAQRLPFYQCEENKAECVRL